MALRNLMIVTALSTLAACEFDVEEPGVAEAPEIEMTEGDLELPEIEIEPGNVEMPQARVIEEGHLEMPEIDVEGPEIEVGTTEKTVTVPDVNVELPSDDDELIRDQ